MTDLICESEDGEITHFYIKDGYPAIVYVRESGTIRVKKARQANEITAISTAKSVIKRL